MEQIESIDAPDDDELGWTMMTTRDDSLTISFVCGERQLPFALMTVNPSGNRVAICKSTNDCHSCSETKPLSGRLSPKYNSVRMNCSPGAHAPAATSATMVREKYKDRTLGSTARQKYPVGGSNASFLHSPEKFLKLLPLNEKEIV